ncbi:TetR/AcrR family transcriptional regulator [Melittangium boletus]|uniref:TetR/AcrR family transcriptional regulator n=1 Tax=Melittangium boletus TaxID=83453 RepID=UPI003DA66066
MTDQSNLHRRRLPPSERGRSQDTSRDELIIGATLELLGEVGYHALTMTDVVARAGVSKATLYRRWTAKADLVADAVATLNPLDPPRYPGTSLRDDLLALMEQAGNCADRPHVVTATMEMARSHPDLYRTLAERFESYVRREIALLAEQAAAAGHAPLSDLDVDMVADTAVALLAYYSGPEAASVSREHLVEVVDRVLMVLMMGTRDAP